jgi:hypothetical protein
MWQSTSNGHIYPRKRKYQFIGDTPEGRKAIAGEGQVHKIKETRLRVVAGTC